MHDPDTSNPPRPDILKVVLTYAIFAGLWILLSDRLTNWLFDNPAYLATAQTLKGWLFVAITSFLLYFQLSGKAPSHRPEKLPQQYSGLINWPRWQLYLFAVLATIIMLLIRNDISLSFSGRPLLILFMFPIILSAALGGLGPGLLSTLLSVLFSIYFATPPFNTFSVAHAYDALPIGFLLASGLLVSFLSMVMHEARRRSENEQYKAKENLIEKMHALHLINGITEGSTDAIFAQDLEGRFILANRAAVQFNGTTIQGMLGKTAADLFPAAQAARIKYDDQRVVQNNQIITVQESLDTPNGKVFFLTTKGPLHDSHGQAIGMFGIARDITEIKNIEEALRRERDRNQRYLDSVQNIMIALDAEGRITMINRYGCNLLGYEETELLGQDWFKTCLPQPGGMKTVYPLFQQIWKGDLQAVEYFEHAVLCRDGNQRMIAWRNGYFTDETGDIVGTLSSGEDITEKQHASAEIHRLAFYDPLTGLPNRALLLERMAQTLAMTRRDKHKSALLLLNIDRFQTINDAGGQVLGDALLKALSERISGLLREGDVLARLSGDEFAVLLPDFAAQQRSAAYQSIHVAEKILASLHAPFNLGDNRLTISACLGIALFPENNDDAPLDILRRSNTALHSAKSKGAEEIAFFEGELDEIAKQRFNIERELREGIASGELRLYLQPQVNGEGDIVGAEALVRWQHPTRGLLSPATFIPIAEESDLIVELGEWVFAQVCQLLVQNDMQRPLRISINLSPRHFRRPNLVTWVKHGLAASGADPMHLTLEITEGIVINNINDVIAKMNDLSAMGIRFSMDDFGTGYSSLAYLKRLPIDELKIDRSFIQDVTTDPENAALVETILAVAKLMQLTVVAEGVETIEQVEFLNERATVIHQGYLFGRPEPAAHLFERMKVAVY